MKEEQSQVGSALTTLENKAAKLDAIADKFSTALITEKTPFSSAIVLAEGISALRELLDDQIMGQIMKLANTPLGFRTDRPNDKNPKPYAVSEVRDAIIEAALRGFRVAGNEFNIIAGNFYGAKAGLRRKVQTYPGVSDFKDTYEVPKIVGDKGAVIAAEATWIKDGVKQKLSRNFAVKSNSFMGSDALIGKCERKLCAAVLNWLSGITTPEGEIDDAIPVKSEVLPTRPAEFDKKGEADKPADPVVLAGGPAHNQKHEPLVATGNMGSGDPARSDDPVFQLTAKLIENKVTTAEVITALIEHAQPVGEANETLELADLPPATVEAAIKHFPTLMFCIHKNRTIAKQQ